MEWVVDRDLHAGASFIVFVARENLGIHPVTALRVFLVAWLEGYRSQVLNAVT